MASCACIEGFLNTTAKPAGDDGAIIGGVKCYVSLPPADAPKQSNLKAIVIIPDVFGWDNPNARLLADQYARGGFVTYVPDVMNGDSLSVSYEETLSRRTSDGVLPRFVQGLRFVASVPSLISWMRRHGDAVTTPAVNAFIAGLRAEHGVTSIGIVGFCWGTRASVLQGTSGSVSAVALVHASPGVDTEVPSLRAPALILCGGDDMTSPSEASFRAALGRASAEIRAASHVITFAGCPHGFAIRGNLNDPVVSKARADACNAVVEFMGKHLL